MSRKYDAVTFGVAIALVLFVAEIAMAGSKLVCDDPLYNFGERQAGESVEHTFAVRNVGDAPAAMDKFAPQCGCAAISAQHDTLAPGGETSVTVKISLENSPGPVRKSVALISDDDKQGALMLTFAGAVASKLVVAPERLELGQIDVGQEVTRTVIVAFAQEAPVKITKIASDQGLMVPKWKAIREGWLYQVTVRLKPLKAGSLIQGKVLLYTDSAEYPMVDIPVAGMVLEDLAATPREITLTGDPAHSIVRYVIVQSPIGKSFDIEDVQCPTASVKAEVKPLGVGIYRIELSGLTATSDLNGKAVLVKTSFPGVPVIRINLHVGPPLGGRRPRQ
jgi:hypothetical protein